MTTPPTDPGSRINDPAYPEDYYEHLACTLGEGYWNGHLASGKPESRASSSASRRKRPFRPSQWRCGYREQ
jgi:hypothetical protein